MRIAWNDKEALEGFKLSRSEAMSSFANDTMFIEKFIERPRHIEIQVLFDGHGNGLWVNERECSIQRRNQKVIEEAPSIFLDPETRKKMGEQAVALAKAVDYKSAGTVEFIVDPNKKFYFLEMNTRLQVEHPVTEYITGIDLVEQMIHIAYGHPLQIKQQDIGIKGWSVESRVYAEDPLKNFLPSIGTLNRYEIPMVDDPDVRCDTGIQEGSEVSIYYDPLISKVITYGKDRNAAIEKMRQALDSYVIRGVTNNINFLRALTDHPRFLSGDINTKFIEEEFPTGFHGYTKTFDELKAVALAGVFVNTGMLRAQCSISGQRSDFDLVNVLNEHRDAVVTVDGETLHVSMDSLPQNGKLDCHISGPGGKTHGVVQSDYSRGKTIFHLTYNGTMHVMQVEAKDISQIYKVLFRGSWHKVQVLSSEQAKLEALMPIPKIVDNSRIIMSPMPGAVFSVSVKEGDTVFEGQDVCVIEAMKMQNTIRAARSGSVVSVKVKKGQTVQADEVLVELS